MKTIEYWKLSTKVTVFQAIMLILDIDPDTYTSKNYSDFVSLGLEENKTGYGAIKSALIEAIQEKALPAKIVEEKTSSDGESFYSVKGSVDIDETKIDLMQVKNFLVSRNFKSDFFLGLDNEPLGYLNRQHPCYAPKLAAAVSVWLAVTQEGKYKTQGTPKQHMEKWLRENASRFGLAKDDGNANEKGISDITIIANWRPEGGAGKTPSVGSGKPTHTKKTKAK